MKVTDFPSIVFDVDNVLADSMSSFCRKASKLLGSEVSKQHIKSHKVVGSVPLSPQAIFKLQSEIWVDWQNVPCIEDNLSKKMRAFHKIGFEVYVATAIPMRLIPYVKKWLEENAVPYSKFFHCLRGRQKKNIQAEALVDDAPEEVRSYISSGRLGFLYLQPWNANTKVSKAILVRNLDDVLKYYGVVRTVDGKYKNARWSH